MLSYIVFTLTLCAIYGLLALSLNLIWGGVGLVNLGLAGFFAVGAYASAIATGAGAPVLLGWGAAIVVGALVFFTVDVASFPSLPACSELVSWFDCCCWVCW